MSTLQAVILGMMRSWTPSLLFMAYLLCTHPTKTPGRRDLPLMATQAATLDCWSAFQFHGSRSATLLAG